MYTKMFTLTKLVNFLQYTLIFFYLASIKRNGENMSIFKKKREINKYKNQSVVTNTIRTDTELALKIDELQTVCSTEKGETISKNKLLTGIISSFIAEIETTASTNEDLATQKLLAVLN